MSAAFILLKENEQGMKKRSGRFWLTQDVNLKDKYFYMPLLFENSYIMVKDTERFKGQSLFQKARKQK